MKKIVSISIVIILFCAVYSSCKHKPDTLPKPEGPSFATDILPIMKQHCTSCHSGFNNYEVVVSDIAVIIRIVQPPSYSMPPRNRTPLDSADISLLKEWQSTGMGQ